MHDLEGFKHLPLDLPLGSMVFGAKAYKDQHEQWLLHEAGGIRFLPLTLKNAKVPLPPCLVYLNQLHKQQVGTAFSLFDRQLPRHIHALSPPKASSSNSKPPSSPLPSTESSSGAQLGLDDSSEMPTAEDLNFPTSFKDLIFELRLMKTDSISCTTFSSIVAPKSTRNAQALSSNVSAILFSTRNSQAAFGSWRAVYRHLGG